MIKSCLKIIILATLFVSCIGKQKIASRETSSTQEEALIFPIYTNDSIEAYNKYQDSIIKTTENFTSNSNYATNHFKKYISVIDLKEIAFKESRKNIYVKFSLNRDKEPINVATNAATEKLDKKIKSAFKKLDFENIQFKETNPLYKHTLIVIQQKDSTAIVKSNSMAIGYSPPIYSLCNDEYNYTNLNACNYLYISEYMYNHIDLSYTRPEDIEYFHKIQPKFIIDEQGKVIAAKITSQNKELIKEYYKALMQLPAAITPAKLNGDAFFYGYNFPTSIVNIIRNNNGFNKFYNYKKSSGKPIRELMKDYVRLLDRKRRKKEIEKVGF